MQAILIQAVYHKHLYHKNDKFEKNLKGSGTKGNEGEKKKPLKYITHYEWNCQNKRYDSD